MKGTPDDPRPPSLQEQLEGTMFDQPFEVGMAASRASAKARWTEGQQRAVDAAIVWCADAYPAGFTTDQIWHRLGPDFPVTKGMASRLNSATRRKVIENTGQLTICQRGNGHDHAQRLTVWCAHR